jgi:hypothetical protein
MGAKVQLKTLVDEMDSQSDELYRYVDRDTGHIEMVDATLLRYARDGDEPPSMPDWQKSEWQVAQRVASTDRLIRLPDQFDLNEWQIMADFVSTVEPDDVRAQLDRAIHGNGAFRMFRDAVRRLGLRDAWDEFEEDALRKIAIEWCEENDIEWE